eukprot:TRINITY_DN41336_c0_g1_i1.p1 TRINITY_DN41336_c0_g1~~TRINITY_DN41336_c0_g1_i1.p1  ORF type:complete len:568 (+),score=117.49 TRINITY_DN41336_c0_g1_i1:41-1744(+)
MRLKDQLLAAFHCCDANHVGIIDRSQFMEIFTSLPHQVMQRDELERFWEQLGGDTSSCVNYEALLDSVFPDESGPAEATVTSEPSARFRELLRVVAAEISPEVAEELLQEHTHRLEKAAELNEMLKLEVQALRRSVNGDFQTLADRRQHTVTTLSTTRNLAERLSKIQTTAQAWAHKKTGWEDEAPAQLWRLAQVDRGRKGGDHHVELEEQADKLRARNESIDEQCREVKALLQADRNDLVAAQAALSACPEDPKLRQRVAELMQGMERADMQLAGLRRQDVRNIEAIRGMKIRIWRLLLDDRVDSVMEEVEVEMRHASVGWFGGRKHRAMQELEEEMKELNFEMQDEMSELLDRAQDLLASTTMDERVLANMPSDDPWAVVGESQPLIDKISNVNFKLQIMAWTLSHTMNRKLSILRKLEKLRRAECMFKRQHYIHQSVVGADKAAMHSELEKLLQQSCMINDHSKAVMEQINQNVADAQQLRDLLLTMKYAVSKKASNHRDELLMIMQDVVTRDMHLAWHRKDQLQMLELQGMLNKHLATSVTLNYHETYPLVCETRHKQVPVVP